MSKLRRHWRPLLFSLALFLINALICQRLFTAAFLDNLSSNDGLFISIARFYREHGIGHGWFPWLNAGMPIENAYQPLLPATAALVSKLSGWEIARAFHFVLAVFYCLGPVALFWFAWDWSRSLVVASIAGLAFSLLSPAEWFLPILRVGFDGHWGALRLYNLIHYAEDPHNVALAILPLALLFLRRAIVQRTSLNLAGAVVFSGAVVLANAFGAVDLVIGGLSLALALGTGWLPLATVGIAGYLWISPWLPPSLINHIRNDQFGARGAFHGGWQATAEIFGILMVFALLWLAARKLPSRFDRFAVLFAFWMCLIPIVYFALDLTLVPQGSRYQLELEMGVCLVIAAICGHIRWRTALLVTVAAVSIWQFILYRRFARELIRPIDITQTIEYKSGIWATEHLNGPRVMMSDDNEYLFNVFSDHAQMSGAHEPTAPNFTQLVAIFTIYTGMNAGDRDAEISLLWLKAFGVEAVYVAGEKSRESYHAIAHPHKFDGILPAIWHEEDDTIFRVPLRTASLAHVIPAGSVVSRPPVHGLDVAQLRTYVAALEDAALPAADLAWDSTSAATIRTSLHPGQVISVQENWALGWRAAANGRPVPARKDGLGLMVVEPACNGPCEVHLEFAPTTEVWICRALSGGVSLGVLALLALRRR